MAAPSADRVASLTARKGKIDTAAAGYVGTPENKARVDAFAQRADARIGARIAGTPYTKPTTPLPAKTPGTTPIRDVRRSAGLPTRPMVPGGPFHLPGGGPNGPIESGPNPMGNFPNIAQMIEDALAKLPADQQAIARQRIGNLPATLHDYMTQIQSHLAEAQQGALPFHPSLEHTHGPDGGMMPTIGQGGLAGIPNLKALLQKGLPKPTGA
jgi:hypothetical protein